MSFLEDRKTIANFLKDLFIHSFIVLNRDPTDKSKYSSCHLIPPQGSSKRLARGIQQITSRIIRNNVDCGCLPFSIAI